jgi:Rieske Fe-S protein
MRRRLPVIQPTAIERRAFLLGILGSSVAACSDEADPATRRRVPTGGTGAGATDAGALADGGSTGGGDGGVRADGGSDASAPRDAGADTGPTGCVATGYDTGSPPSAFAMGTITYVSSVPPVFVGRDANGIYAMGALCTHSIGNFQQSNGQLVCLVHGARFSFTGQVLQGPATIDLPHFDACINAKGNVAVDQTIIVPSSTRLKA